MNILYFVPQSFDKQPRLQAQHEIGQRLCLDDISRSHDNPITPVNANKFYDVQDWDDLFNTLKDYRDNIQGLVVAIDGRWLKDKRWFVQNKIKLLTKIGPEIPIVAYLCNAEKDSAFLLHAAGFPVVVDRADDERTLASATLAAFCNKREDTGRVIIGPLTIDLTSKDLYFEGELIETTPFLNFSDIERRILVYLASNLNRNRSKEQILRVIWEDEEKSPEVNTVAVAVSKLRAKLDQLDPIRFPDLGNQIVRTVWGTGLCIKKWDGSYVPTKNSISTQEAIDILSQQMTHKQPFPANDIENGNSAPTRPGQNLGLDKNNSCLRIDGFGNEGCVIPLDKIELSFVAQLMENPGVRLSSMDWSDTHQKLFNPPKPLQLDLAREKMKDLSTRISRMKPKRLGNFLVFAGGTLTFIPPKKCPFSISTPTASANTPS